MQTAGRVLKAARNKKGLTLAQVEKATKIKVRILEKLESDDFDAIGSFGHTLGLVKNYGEFLELNTDFLTALLRRQADFSQTPPRPTFLKFPKFLVGAKTPLVAVLIIALVFVYLIFQLVSLRTGPKLEIFQPPAGSVVNLSKIQVAGITEPEAQVVINGQKVPTNLSGEFSTEFELTKGVNVIEIVAKGRLGVERKVVRTVELTN